jgi:hypothetical protein
VVLRGGRPPREQAAERSTQANEFDETSGIRKLVLTVRASPAAQDPFIHLGRQGVHCENGWCRYSRLGWGATDAPMTTAGET